MYKVARFAGVLSVLSLITVFAVALLAGASTVELIADSDSTLRRGYNNLNEGANKELFVMRDGPKRAIVSFDIGVLDPASQVVDAQLFLTVADDAVKWEAGLLTCTVFLYLSPRAMAASSGSPTLSRTGAPAPV